MPCTGIVDLCTTNVIVANSMHALHTRPCLGCGAALGDALVPTTHRIVTTGVEHYMQRPKQPQSSFTVRSGRRQCHLSG